ncbi:MAG: acetyl-CoA carboxylase biotin carboxyl carrier protein [Helicobacteraceae bacterium]|nr:acetyl-CoA carboxylase biotin carboxyl carrier protein [Helicobacteraceae bacterium]
MLTLEEIRSLADYLDKSSLSKIKIRQDGFSVTLERRVAAAPVFASAVAERPIAPPNAVALSAIDSKDGETISSPMVGTFYRSPSPDSPPFVSAGDQIAKGKPLCVLEAMKIFNEVEAEYDCAILEILVEDGQVVEYDTPLFRVKRN